MARRVRRARQARQARMVSRRSMARRVRKGEKGENGEPKKHGNPATKAKSETSAEEEGYHFKRKPEREGQTHAELVPTMQPLKKTDI